MAFVGNIGSLALPKMHDTKTKTTWLLFLSSDLFFLIGIEKEESSSKYMVLFVPFGGKEEEQGRKGGQPCG